MKIYIVLCMYEAQLCERSFSRIQMGKKGCEIFGLMDDLQFIKIIYDVQYIQAGILESCALLSEEIM